MAMRAKARRVRALQFFCDCVDLGLLSSKLPREPFLDGSHLESDLSGSAGRQVLHLV